MFNDKDFKVSFWTILLLAAAIGWGVIEIILWFVRNISLSWGN